ncbi:MAG: DUF799 domain-containing protein [Bacteroidales bacterium]|nr:DUF799 domain-containing protein [Bacteroidales bacterium]
MRRAILLLSVVLTIAGCGTPSRTRGSLYPAMYEEKPVTLLVMPPINNTSSVQAKELLYTSISRPLAEAGYYVISPSLAMDVLKQESAYDAEMFIDQSLKPFHDFFGADAVVFSVINEWAKQITGIQTEIRYIIKSAVTDQVLFDRTCSLYLDLSVDSRTDKSKSQSLLGALLDVAVGALNTALTDNIEAARKANYYIFEDLPVGKYDDLYMKDQDYSADPRIVRRRVK